MGFLEEVTYGDHLFSFRGLKHESASGTYSISSQGPITVDQLKQTVVRTGGAGGLGCLRPKAAMIVLGGFGNEFALARHSFHVNLLGAGCSFVNTLPFFENSEDSKNRQNF
jgi:hypothetical protein